MSRQEETTIPFSNFKKEVVEKLVKMGYLESATVVERNIVVVLKYENGEPVFTDVTIFSKPGQRHYVSYKELKSVMGGMGHSLLSTSKGVKTNSEARYEKVGGELLFNIW